MAKTPAGWKAYDVIVGGVSLVTNYRDEFNEQIKSGGVDGLIKTLADEEPGRAGEVTPDAAPRGTAARGAFACATASAGASRARSTFDDATAVLEAAAALAAADVAASSTCRGLAHADSAALAVLLALQARARPPRSARLSFAAIPPMLASLARVYGVEDMLLDAASMPAVATRSPIDRARRRSHRCRAPLRHACRRWPASTSRSSRASSSGCSGPTARARPR